MNTVY